MKTIIFLDIDGVLASYVDMLRIDEYGPKFIPEAVDALNKLIEYTEADICVSSAWRVGKSVERLQEIMDARGVRCNIVGKTGHFGARGEEIKEWYEDNPEYEELIIIDDEMVDIFPTYPYNWRTHIYTNPYRCLDIYDIGRITRKAWPNMPNYIKRTTRDEVQGKNVN